MNGRPSSTFVLFGARLSPAAARPNADERHSSSAPPSPNEAAAAENSRAPKHLFRSLEVHAAGIVADELKRRRWDEAELGRRAKGDAQKLAMAVRLRAETAVTVKWIAERLRMGTPGYANHLLYRRRKRKRE